MVEKKIKILTRAQQEEQDIKFWSESSHRFRIETLEDIKYSHHGHQPRLERVFRIVKR